MMKALSLIPMYACYILSEEKTLELRSWKTDYRGDLLICSSAKRSKGIIPSHALCVVTLTDIVPFKKTPEMCRSACVELEDWLPGYYAWKLENVRMIKPFPVKGKLHLWDCDEDIEILHPQNAEEDAALFMQYYDPLIVR